MLVVRIELWPRGNEAKKRELGLIHITNDGTRSDDSGDAPRGNYIVKLFKSAVYSARAAGTVWKAGHVEDFPRKRLGPYDLLFRALRATVGARNGEPGCEKQRRQRSGSQSELRLERSPDEPTRSE